MFRRDIALDSGHTDPAFVEAVGRAADGVCSRDEFSLSLAKHKPMITEINLLYKERFGGDMRV